MTEMPQPPPAGSQPAPATAADPRGTVGSLVWAIVGFNVLPVIGSIVAVVMGRNARRRAREAGRADPSVARAGRVLGWVGIAIAVAVLLLIVVGAALSTAFVDQLPQGLPEA